MNKIYLFIILTFFIVFISVCHRLTSRQKEISDKYFKALGVELSGIVMDKKEIWGNSGMLYIKIINSNVRDYDPRDSLRSYYCIIKRDKAEIIEGALPSINVGDSVIVSCKRDSFYYYRNGLLRYKYPLYLRQDPEIVNHIKEYSRL